MALLRRIFWLSIRIVVALAIVGTIAGGLLTLTPLGRDFIASTVSTLASSEGRSVRIGGLNGLLSGNLSIDHIVVEDSDGPWLVARSVKTTWSPSYLFSGEVRVEAVSAERIEVGRLPKPEPGPASDEPFSLPVTIDVGRISLPDVALGGQIAGEIAQIGVDGSLHVATGPLVVTSALDFVRKDAGKSGTLAANVDFAPNDNRLTLDVVANEPAGGVIANLLRLPNDAPVSVLLSGQGPLSNWKGDATLSLGGIVLTRISATHQVTGQGRRIDARGGGAFEQLVPAAIGPLLAGQTEFDVAVTLLDNGGVRIERGTLASAAARASAGGTYDPSSNSDLTLNVSAASAPIPLKIGSEGSTVELGLSRVALRASGAGQAPAVDASLALSSMTAPMVEIGPMTATARSPGFDLAALTGPVAIAIEAENAGSPDQTIASLLAGSLSLRAETVLDQDTIRIRSAAIESGTQTSMLEGSVSRSDGSLSLNLQSDLLSAALPAAAAPVLGERTALSGTVARARDGAISVNPLSLTSGGLTANGSVVLSGGTIGLALQGRLADIAPLVPHSSGSVSFAANAAGDLGAPDVNLTMTSDRLVVSGQTFDAVELTTSGIIDLDAPAARIGVKARFSDQPLTVNAALRTTGGGRELSELVLALGPNRATGDLKLDEAFRPEGTLAVAVEDAAALASVVGEQVQGTLTGAVNLSIDNGVPLVTFEANSPSLIRESVKVSTVSLAGTARNYFSVPEVSARLVASQVSIGATQVANLDVTTSQDGAWIHFSGGAAVNGIPAQASGRVNLDGGAVTVELAEADAVVQDVPLRLSQPATIVVRDGVTTLRALAFDLAGGRISASGTVGTGFDLAVDLASLPASVIARFAPGMTASGALAATARLTGPLDRPAIDLSASLEGAGTGQIEARELNVRLQSAGFDLSTQSGPFVLDLQAASILSSNSAIAPLLAGPLSFAAKGTLATDAITIETASVRNDAVSAAATASLSLRSGGLRADVNADVLSAALPAAARPALAERTTIQASVLRDPEGRLSVDPLSISSGDFAAAGSVSLTGETLDAAIEGTLGEVGRLTSNATGSIAFSAKATGPFNAPQLDLSVNSDRFVAAGREITGLDFTASGVANLDAPTADVTLRGMVAGERLSGSATLRSEGGRSDLSDLSITLGKNSVAGSLMLDEAFVPVGTLDLDLPDIGSLAALAFQEIDGALTGTFRFAKPAGVPEMVLDADVGSLTRADLSAKGVSVEASVRNYLAAPSVAGRITVGSITAGGAAIIGADVTLGRDGDWTTFAAAATINDIPAKASGRAKYAAALATVDLASAEATLRGLAVRLAQRTTVTIENGETRLDRLAVNVGGGRVQATGSISDRLNLNLQISALPASAINAFAPGLGATGTIGGTVKLSGATANPEIGYTIDWRGAQTSQTSAAGFSVMTVSSTGTLANSRLRLTANASDGRGLGLQGGGEVLIAGARTLALDFAGTVPFSFLTGRLAAQGLSLTGGANVDLSVRGPLTAPAVSGTISSSGARFIDTRSGIAVNDISARISIANGVATISPLNGTLSTSGSISASGTIGIDAAQGFPANLTLRVSDGRYTDGQVVTTTVNGELAIKGSLASMPALTGAVNLGKTVIQVPDRLPASLSTLNVQHKNAPAAVRTQDQAIRPPEAANSSGGITLDITVNAPQQIFVQGRGLDAELGGSLRLTGPAGAPTAIGDFTLRRGRLALLGRRLDFTRGTLGFSGSLVPYLDFSADSPASDATATVSIAGPANNPKFVFSSVPALPEDEVLARLIFGKAMSTLSPLQIAQLADAVATLAGVGGTSGLLGTLRSKMGVDDIDVKTDEQGRAAVSVGKYLNDRTYVTIEKGEGSGSGKATINLDVGRGVKLRGEATDRGEGKAGIFYEREY